MTAILSALLACLLAPLGARHVTVWIGEREWYGGQCEERAVEVEIDGKWWETKPMRCGRRGR